MLQAVIFDFDGIIADSEPLHFLAFKEVLEKNAIAFTKQDYYEKYLGYTDSDFVNAVCIDKKLSLSESQAEKIIEEKCEAFTRLLGTQKIIIDGVENFLNLLKKNNIRICICSGAFLHDIEHMLKSSGLRGFFEFIVSADDITNGKPDPEGFLLALKKLNENSKEKIAAEDCVIIEDSHWGIEAAQAAGMHTIAVTNTYTADELTKADAVIHHLDELTIERLQKLCK